MLKVKLADVFRATLADDCGNVGFLGFAPDSSAYHVVAPVDYQIARGVKAGNRPADGTPFGGYKGWRYFECLSFPSVRPDGRENQTRRNAQALMAWAAAEGLGLEIEE
ncbi:MAG: hypothetical protein AB1896_15635 [Thermodesulfobacteriota bacterium]